MSATVGPVEIAPAYEVVVRHLRRAIHLGTFAPGSRLPTERELAPQLGVSRVTLREALHVLKGEGYVDIRRGQQGGVFVRDRLEDHQGVRQWFADQGNDMDAVFAFRSANERLAARRAAAYATAEDINELVAQTDKMDQTDDIGSFRHADLNFHLRLADAACAALIRRAVEEARAALFVPFQLLPLEAMRERSVPQHRRIIEAVRDGDSDAADEAMATHVARTAEALGREDDVTAQG
jgi:DNA-binding FadR family transcriptional regulator